MSLVRQLSLVKGGHRYIFRYQAGREVREVETPWGTVRVKVKLLAGKAVAVSPEYDDCARLAAQSGVPLAEVMATAQSAAAAGSAGNSGHLGQKP